MNALMDILHYVAFSIGIGGGVASMIIGIRMKRAEAAAAPTLAGIQKTIGRTSFGALIVLWLTGLWMVSTRFGWGALPWAFWIKFAAVLGLTGFALTAQWFALQAGRTGTPPAPATMAKLGMGLNACALLALIFAVIAFG